MCEVWPMVLIRESSTQLVMYFQILYVHVLTDFQVSERLHGGPEFSGNYLIANNRIKVSCYWGCNIIFHVAGGIHTVALLAPTVYFMKLICVHINVHAQNCIYHKSRIFH